MTCEIAARYVFSLKKNTDLHIRPLRRSWSHSPPLKRRAFLCVNDVPQTSLLPGLDSELGPLMSLAINNV